MLNKLKFNQSSWFSHFVRVPYTLYPEFLELASGNYAEISSFAAYHVGSDNTHTHTHAHIFFVCSGEEFVHLPRPLILYLEASTNAKS